MSRELLENAAKAIPEYFKEHTWNNSGLWTYVPADPEGDDWWVEPYEGIEYLSSNGGFSRWNPLLFSDEAFELTAALGIDISTAQLGVFATYKLYNPKIGGKEEWECFEPYSAHPSKVEALRYVIVKAAANIGAHK